MELKEIDYREVKIDKCFSCDGVWLDAGEIAALTQLEQGALGRFFGIFKK
jgi:Zn-finger nucleic acid-binding protein